MGNIDYFCVIPIVLFFAILELNNCYSL